MLQLARVGVGPQRREQQPQRPLPAPAKSFPIAWVLSLVLGAWGADRFYLGKWKTGLLKLFTFGGLLVWWLGSNWPDLLVGFLTAIIAIKGGVEILRDARKEARQATEPGR